MIETASLVLTGILFALLSTVVMRAVISKDKILGKPPIPVVLFILAKALVLVNLLFLALYGLRVRVPVIFEPPLAMKLIALAFLLIGVTLLFLSILRLNRDLIFGLSDSASHQLQANGIYRLSRHPFYLGFLCVLFSSCLFSPGYLNLAAFIGAWFLHHLIMIKEEESLEEHYGDAYKNYKRAVNRYLNLK